MSSEYGQIKLLTYKNLCKSDQLSSIKTPSEATEIKKATDTEHEDTPRCTEEMESQIGAVSIRDEVSLKNQPEQTASVRQNFKLRSHLPYKGKRIRASPPLAEQIQLK